MRGSQGNGRFRFGAFTGNEDTGRGDAGMEGPNADGHGCFRAFRVAYSGMSEAAWRIERIRPGEPGWFDAVHLKRSRAYRIVARDTGLSVGAIHELYEGKAIRGGLPFHEAMLRAEIADRPLLLFYEGDVPVGYACLGTTTLIETNIRACIVTDICLDDDLSPMDRAAWCIRVVHEAQATGAENVQITVDGADAPTMLDLGGELFKSTWHWRSESQGDR